MNSRDAILKALTPNDMFNQKALIWRSISTLAQFAGVKQEEVLGILDEHFQNLVSVRPNGKYPHNGPLVALNEHIQPDPPADDPQVAGVDHGAVAAAIEGVAAAANGDVPAVTNPPFFNNPHAEVAEEPVPEDASVITVEVGGPEAEDELSNEAAALLEEFEEQDHG